MYKKLLNIVNIQSYKYCETVKSCIDIYLINKNNILLNIDNKNFKKKFIINNSIDNAFFFNSKDIQYIIKENLRSINLKRKNTSILIFL